jgi:antitoxin HigA-1
MALRIEKAFGPKMDHLLRIQLEYDMAQARKRERNLKVRRARRAA